MQHERPARRLIAWCPLYSNYFAYSYGEAGDGIHLYHIGRPSVDTEPGLQVGARGSIMDITLDHPGIMGGFASQQVLHPENHRHARPFFRHLCVLHRCYTVLTVVP